jgi:antitoxin component of MazEF toxin-antitoxin module
VLSPLVQSSNEGIISLPASLMRSLNLHEGEKIKTIIEGKTLRLTSLEQFLALRGTLSENSEFDAAINFLI